VNPTIPETNEALRRAIYGGEIFLLAPTAASRDLVAEINALLVDAFPEVDDPRDAAAVLGDALHFERIGAIRRTLFCEPLFHRRVREVAEALGFAPDRVAFDPIRLRVVGHRGAENPRARAVYTPHRDTWYAHSQSAIAWWIPLHDAPEDQTFVFYPQRFAAPVANDSERFTYTSWIARGWDLKIGWQRRDAGLEAHYPGALGGDDWGPEVGFAATRAQNLLFAGAQFHRTRDHAGGRTRFSLDFRIVDLGDHQRGGGAPNADNRSVGSAVVDYVHPPGTGAGA
jgi:hypothetical protein